jgi:hypothetical protein
LKRSRVFFLVFFVLFLFFAFQGAYIFGIAIVNLSLVLQDVAFLEWGLSYVSIIVCSEIILNEGDPYEKLYEGDDLNTGGVCSLRSDDPIFEKIKGEI